MAAIQWPAKVKNGEERSFAVSNLLITGILPHKTDHLQTMVASGSPGKKCRVDVRGQRIMARLLQGNRNNHALQKSIFE